MRAVFIKTVASVLLVGAVSAHAQTNTIFATNSWPDREVNVLEGFALNATNSSHVPSSNLAQVFEGVPVVSNINITAPSLASVGILPNVAPSGTVVSLSELGIVGGTGTLVQAELVPQAFVAVVTGSGTTEWMTSAEAAAALSTGEATSPWVDSVSSQTVQMTLDATAMETLHANGSGSNQQAFATEIITSGNGIGVKAIHVLYNEGFEIFDSCGWSVVLPASENVLSRTEDAHSGSVALMLSNTDEVQSPFIPVSSLRSYFVSAYIKGQGQLAVDEYDSDKQIIRRHEAVNHISTEYQRSLLRIETSENCEFVKITLSNPGISTLFLDDVQVY